MQDTHSRLTFAHRSSQRFNGSQGPAFLLAAVRNVREDEVEERLMTTGTHMVRDVSCATCGQSLGWKYVSRAQPSDVPC